MKVIPPIPVTDATLTTPAVAEPDTSVGEAIWVAATPYTKGQRAIRTSTHRVYERLIAGTTATAPESDTTNWLDVGPTNRWAMFDLLRNTGTTKVTSLSATVTPGTRVDSIGVVGIVADSITITVTISAVVVYTYTQDLRTRDTLTWYDYFFGTFDQKTAVALFNLPPYSNSVITVSLTRSSGNCICGGVVIAQAVDLGVTIHGAENDALNFSKIDRDDFGTATLQQRRTVPKNNVQTRIKKMAVNRAINVRIDLNAMPALWSGLDDASSGYFEPLLILGVYKRFTVLMDQPDSALISLELEEV